MGAHEEAARAHGTSSLRTGQVTAIVKAWSSFSR